jgi:hypothetical protein
MHVAHNDCKNDTDRLSRWKFVESALPYFNMAIDALQNLDRGNRSVERCVSYLSQLTIVPLVSCELTQFCPKLLSKQEEADTDGSTG